MIKDSHVVEINYTFELKQEKNYYFSINQVIC